METEDTKTLRMSSSVIAIICQQSFPSSLKMFLAYFSKQKSVNKVCYWQARSSSLSFSIMQPVKTQSALYRGSMGYTHMWNLRNRFSMAFFDNALSLAFKT